ncbi:MAG: lytic transglycosylase domain-containing protein [Ferruginibacter sp.]
MDLKTNISKTFCTVILLCAWCFSAAHDIYFCGEKIPIDDKIVTDKLMNIIKKQIKYVDIASLRKSPYMPQVERWLQATNLPQDFKYLAIVESGFKKDAASSVGAKGFWQLMPKTAIEWELTVNEFVDERTDFDKSTYAACRLLANYYLYIRKTFGISSWVLTAAAYNNGIGNIKNAISKQGKNYFSMNLNAETAAYVYKIIAVKELFEYPELYMKDFGYNVFSAASKEKVRNLSETYDTSSSDLTSMKVDINVADGQHPDNLQQAIKKDPPRNEDDFKVKFISAKIIGTYKKIEDGDLVTFKLDGDLQVQNRFTSRGGIIQGRAWIVDNKVLVDLGYDHDVTLNDLSNEKGIALSSIKNKQAVILKVKESYD